MNEKHRRALESYNDAVKAMNEAADAVDQLADDAAEADVEAAERSFQTAKGEVERTKKVMDAANDLAKARSDNPVVQIPDRDEPDAPELRDNDAPAGKTRTVTAPGLTRVAIRTETKTYRPDLLRSGEVSYFRDLANAKAGNSEARERLDRSNHELLRDMGFSRDMSTTSTAGGDFLPPLYLADLYVEPSIAKRPFVDVLPKLDLPPSGIAITIPKLASGVSVAGRSDNGSVSETDGVTATVSHDVNEIAGLVDIGRIDVMRSQPAIDMVIARTLVRRYNAQVDTYALSGTGTAPQHTGIRGLSGKNSSVYTASTPAQTGLIPKLYDGIQQNWNARKGETEPDTIVYHPRRAAWLASALSTSVPLFPQSGAGVQALGQQNHGFLVAPLGLREVVDPNVGTTYGAGTNEDEIYIVNSQDLLFMEGPLYTRVHEDVGSGTGTIRYALFAFSAFLSKRYPEAVCVVSGTGLAAPTF